MIMLKVRQFQNEFMKSSFLPKYEQKIVRISALTKGQLISKAIYGLLTSPKKWTKIVRISARCSKGKNPDNFLFVFWEKRWLHKFILKLTNL